MKGGEKQMKKIFKTFLLSLIVLVLATNISNANTEITEKANKTLEKMFFSIVMSLKALLLEMV